MYLFWFELQHTDMFLQEHVVQVSNSKFSHQLKSWLHRTRRELCHQYLSQPDFLPWCLKVLKNPLVCNFVSISDSLCNSRSHLSLGCSLGKSNSLHLPEINTWKALQSYSSLVQTIEGGAYGFVLLIRSSTT